MKKGKETGRIAGELGRAGVEKAEKFSREGILRAGELGKLGIEKSEEKLEELKAIGLKEAEFLTRRKRWLVMVLVALCGAMLSTAENMIGIAMGASFPHDMFGVVIVASLCGSVPGFLSVIFLFTYKVLVQTASIYSIAIYFIVVLIASITARRGFYKSIRKAGLLALVFNIFTGVGVIISNVIVGNGLTIQAYRDSMYALFVEIPFSLMTVSFIYLSLNLCPERYRIYFPNTLHYSRDEVTRRVLEKRLKDASGLSYKITLITTLEATVLAIAAAVFANILVGNMDFSHAAGRSMPPEMMYHDPGLSNNEAIGPSGEREAPPEKPSPNDDGSFFPRMVSRNDAYMPKKISGDEIFKDRNAHFNDVFNNSNLSAENQLAFTVRLIMLIIAFSAVTGLVANLYAQKKIAEPIKDISKAMSDFAYSKDDMRVEGTEAINALRINTRDEIEELYHAILKTVGDLNGYLERIQKEEQMENELRVARAASEAKSNFLSSMSHEIRTPINAVLGFDEMILMENKDPDIEKYAEDIQSAGRTLLSLINDILDFSKIEAGKMNIVPVEYELCSTVNDMINMAASLAKDKGLYLDVNVDSNMPHLLYGDEVRLKQIILNILTNAVKYTEKGGVTFNIGYEKIDDDNIYFICSIKDTGIGIKSEDMDKLFSPFERLDEQKNSAVKGTGLGMSITKQLLAKMGSALEVESVYGEGSTFSFRVVQKVTKWEEVGNLSEAFKKYLPHDADKHKNDRFYAPDAKILVVDDTEYNLLVVTRLLKRTKIQIDTASGGRETLELICRNRYDIVYIDHMMPEMDGIETFKQMKVLEGNLNRDVPWIVLTANAVSGAREKYMAEGFTDYMTKPVNYLTLKNSLIRYLPEGRILEETEANEEDTEKTSDDRNEEACACRLKKLMNDIDGIDYEEGLKNSDCEEILLEVVKGYHDSIEDKAAAIENSLKNKEYKNYTVFVHALKSSSRLIGAMELSALAAKMEEAGNAVLDNEEGTDEYESALGLIKEKTPELLTTYRGFKDKLEEVASSGDEVGDKPEIDEGSLKEIMSAVCEFAEAFDFDSADSAMKEIGAHRIPEQFREKTERLSKLVRNIDRDGILEFKKEAL